MSLSQELRSVPNLLSMLRLAMVPVFLVLFFGIILGLMVGFVWEWLREHKHRKTASVRGRELARLERELAVMKDSTSVPHRDDVLALIDTLRAAVPWQEIRRQQEAMDAPKRLRIRIG